LHEAELRIRRETQTLPERLKIHVPGLEHARIITHTPLYTISCDELTWAE